MDYINKLKNLVIGDQCEEKVSKILPISDKEFSCKPDECHNKYKESCFELRGDVASLPLYESAKPADLHFLVSTGKTDWEHDAFEEENTILGLFATEAKKLGNECDISTSSNVTNQPLNIMDADYLSLNKLDVLLQPWFVWIKGLTKDNMVDIFRVVKDVVSKSKADESVRGTEGVILIERLKEFKDVRVEKDINRAYILLCSHRTRDKKCGITAPLMKKEFDSELQEHDLYRDASDDREGGAKVIFVNHVGGHKFAANVLVYNKNGEFVWFARCNPTNVKFIVNETVLNHKVYPKNIRACASHDAIRW